MGPEKQNEARTHLPSVAHKKVPSIALRRQTLVSHRAIGGSDTAGGAGDTSDRTFVEVTGDWAGVLPAGGTGFAVTTGALVTTATRFSEN